MEPTQAEEVPKKAMSLEDFENQLRDVIVKAMKSQIHPENVYAVLHKITHIQQVLLDANILSSIEKAAQPKG